MDASFDAEFAMSSSEYGVVSVTRSWRRPPRRIGLWTAEKSWRALKPGGVRQAGRGASVRRVEQRPQTGRSEV